MMVNAHSLYVYLQFRMRQLGRMLYSAGWPGLVALPILVILGLQGIEAAAALPPWAMPVFTGFLMLLWHGKRRDGAFLKRTGFWAGLVWGVEYAVVSSCAVLPVAWYTENWWIGIVAAIVAFTIAFLPVGLSAQSRALPVVRQLVPEGVFEWGSALRRYGVLFFLLWLLSLTAFFGMAVLLIAMLLWSSLIPSVFEYQEPRAITLSVVVGGGGLFRHMLRHLGLQCIVFAPGILLHLLFHRAFWYMPVIGLGFIALLLAFAIYYKYATWQDGRQRVAQGLPVTLACCSLFFPLLVPVVAVYLWRYIIRARHHFKTLYHVEDPSF